MRTLLLTIGLLCSMFSSPVCRGTVTPASFGRAASLTVPEQQWTSAVHDSEFATLAQSLMHANCGAMQLPQALATPDPLLDEPDANAKIRVSFIVGTDGRVHSPLILESAGNSEDRNVLNAVRSWRFRPALCNGVPTDAEAKVEFSIR